MSNRIWEDRFCFNGRIFTQGLPASKSIVIHNDFYKSAVKHLISSSIRHFRGVFMRRAINLSRQLGLSLRLAVSLAMLAATADAVAQSVSRCAFVSNAYDQSITQYLLDPSGDLLNQGRSYSINKYPAFIVVHPNQRWAYVPSRTLDLLWRFDIDNRTCRLTAQSDEPLKIHLRSPFNATFHPSGKYLYVAGRAGAVGAYAVDLKTGKLSLVPGQPFPSGERTRSVAVHPNGKFVYATSAYKNWVAGFRVDMKTGALKELQHSPYSSGETGPFANVPPMMPDLNKADRGPLPYNIRIHPNGKFAYVTNYVASSISMYRIDEQSGDLQLIDKPIATGRTPYPIAIHPNGQFAYVACWEKGDIYVYAIDQQSGRLSERKDLRADVVLLHPTDIQFNQDASRMYVVSISGDDVTQLSVDANSGALKLRRRATTRAGALTVAFSQDEKYAEPQSNEAFVISAQKRELYRYSVIPNDGRLRLQTKNLTGKDPSSVAWDPQGRVVMVSNRGDNNLSIYNIKQKDELARASYSPVAVGAGPEQLKIDDNGWYVYFANRGDKSLQFMLMHKDTAEPAQAVGSPLPLTMTADILRLDPLAKFTFAWNKEKQLMSFNRSLSVIMSANNPQQAWGSPVKIGVDIDLMEIDETGRFMLMVDNKHKLLRLYRIHPANGTLHEVKESALVSDGKVRAVKFQPLAGRVLLVLSEGKLQAYTFDSVLGELKATISQKVNKQLNRMWISSDGKFVYLASKSKNNTKNKAQLEIWIVPLQLRASNSDNRLDAVSVSFSQIQKQSFNHDITDMVFSLDIQ